MLTIKDLTVKVENKKVLDKFNLDVEKGSIHVIMGPNGTGKSTLTKAIMNEPNYKVISGDILFNDKSILKLSTDERARLGIFLAMQNPPEINGVANSDFIRTSLSNIKQENINLYSFIKEIEKNAKNLKMLNEMIHRSVNKGFSGGEKKKNEILQMLMLKPKLIILDEIDSGVDVDSLKTLCLNINNYIKENKDVSLLIITHYTHILKYIKPDYVHVINNGKIVKTGSYYLAKEIEDNGFNFDKVVSSELSEGEISE